MVRTIARDHGEKRQHILRTAARVFAEQGYDRASMNHVAQECGVSKANIYHYYDSKDALLLDLLQGHLTALRDRVAAVPLTGLEPEERLHLILREILLAQQGGEDEHKILLTGLALIGAEEQKALRQLQREVVDQVSAILRDLAPESLGTDRAKLRAVTMSVFGMLNWYAMWKPNAGAGARETYARLVTDFALGGVRGI